MDTAPHKVLLLGWDAPAGAPSAVTTLATALAPESELTLLMPHLSGPLSLPAQATATDLSQLQPAALDQMASVWSVAELESWQAPAAPYLGATAAGNQGASQAPGAASFNSPAAPYIGRAEASMPASSPGAQETRALQPEPELEASVLPFSDADATEFTRLATDDFATEGEPDTTEANHLTQATDDFEPDMPGVDAAPETRLAAAQEAPAPIFSVQQRVFEIAVSALRTEAADSAALNFRVIQYARLATRLAASQDFAVIYAADWEAWLAGMEIRQLTGRPLVLQVQSLAADRNSIADRGWVQALERLALRRADLVLVASPDLAARIAEVYLLPQERVLVLDEAQNGSLTSTILAALNLA